MREGDAGLEYFQSGFFGVRACREPRMNRGFSGEAADGVLLGRLSPAAEHPVHRHRPAARAGVVGEAGAVDHARDASRREEPPR